MNNFVTGLIRTFVPIAVGAAIAWLITLDINVDSGAQASAIIALTGVLQAVYYAGVRLLAKKWPGVEILLGASVAPDYSGDNPESP